MITTFITLLVIYIVVGTIIALVSRRFGVKTSAEYFVAGYRLGGFLASMTYAATTYSAFMMVGLVGYAYATGVGSLGFELAYLLSTIVLLAIFAPRVWLMARNRRWVSPSEMISDLYDSRLLGMVIAVLYLIALVPYISAQMIGIGSIFEGIGVGYLTGVLVAAILIFMWIAIAGIWSVASTDAYQGLWMILAALTYVTWLSLYLLPAADLDINRVSEILGKIGMLGITKFWSLTTFIAFTLPWLFFAITNPQVVQRLYMPKSEKSLKRLVQYFAIYGFMYTIIVVLVGLLARALSESGFIPMITNRDLVTPTLLLLAHPLLASFIYVSIVAAAVSTANSIILSVASSFVRDFYERRVKVVNHKISMLISLCIVTSLIVIASLVAYFRPGFIVELSVLSSVILLPLAPLTIMGWILGNVRKVRIEALTSLLAGSIIALSAAVIYGPKKSFITTWIGLPISAWVLIISTVILLIGIIRSKYLS